MSAPDLTPRAPAGGARTLPELVAEAQRVLAICNACRYCEGYCAVFPALQRRLAFDEGDVHYLANLCHNCGSCLYACQYAPPHEFQLNLPRTLAQVRVQTYRQHAWPSFLGRLYAWNGVVVALVLAACLAAMLAFTAWSAGPARFTAAFSLEQGSFYAVMPHEVMVAIFGSAAAFVALALAIGVLRYWRAGGERLRDFLHPLAAGDAVADALRLTYLGGGGEGCRYPDATPTVVRRDFHHLTFYGFLLCVAATATGTVYHYLFGREAPYAVDSLPVILGSLGGLALIIGPVGLLWIKFLRDPELADPAQVGMDAGFLLLLLLTSVTGFALLALRETDLLGTLLAVHLGVVLALFLTMPYGKFAHAVFRFAALVRFHLERRRPRPAEAAE